jgi:hypothetical protein
VAPRLGDVVLEVVVHPKPVAVEDGSRRSEGRAKEYPEHTLSLLTLKARARVQRLAGGQVTAVHQEGGARPVRGVPCSSRQATQPLLPDSSSLYWWRIAAIR